MLEKAFATALRAHDGQHRVSGEDYIHHPLGVARILAELQIDADSIAAALLHDVVEDTTVTLEQIEKDTDRDNFLSAEEAREYGLIDQVLSRRAAAA